MKHIHAQSLIVHRSTDPTVNDNASRGFAVESEWYNGTTFWKLTSFSGSDAIWEQVGGGSGGTRITDSSTITTITTNSNYNDSYGNASPAIGGIFNTTIPSGINEGDYYIEPFATDGTPKHKIECKRNASGNLILIKIPYLQ
jgi:hypothetical protein